MWPRIDWLLQLKHRFLRTGALVVKSNVLMFLHFPVLCFKLKTLCMSPCILISNCIRNENVQWELQIHGELPHHGCPALWLLNGEHRYSQIIYSRRETIWNWLCQNLSATVFCVLKSHYQRSVTVSHSSSVVCSIGSPSCKIVTVGKAKEASTLGAKLLCETTEHQRRRLARADTLSRSLPSFLDVNYFAKTGEELFLSGKPERAVCVLSLQQSWNKGMLI